MVQPHNPTAFGISTVDLAYYTGITRRLQHIKIRLDDLDRTVLSDAPTGPLPPTSIELNIQGGCDSFCRHCTIWKDKAHSVPFDMVKQTLDQLKAWVKPGTAIHLVGGEPTMHPELPNILRLVHDMGFPCWITTNGGRLADDGYARALLQSGIRQIVISIDGFQEQHNYTRGKGSFERLIAGIDTLKSIDPSIIICSISVLMERNYAVFPDFIPWARETHDVNAFFFQALTFDFAADMDSMLQQNPKAAYWTSRKAHLLTKVLGGPLWPKDFAKLDATLDAFIRMKTSQPIGHFMVNPVEQFAFWKNYYRNPIGFVTAKPCNVGDFNLEVDHYGHLRLCSHKAPIGRLEDGTLKDLYYGDTAQERRKEIRECRIICNSLLNCRFRKIVATRTVEHGDRPVEAKRGIGWD